MHPRHTLPAPLRSLLLDEDGPTATEYAVMMAMMILVMIGIVASIGAKVNTLFTQAAAAW